MIAGITIRRLVFVVVLLCTVGAALGAPGPAVAYSSSGVPVIMVHGFNRDDSIPGGCNGGTTFGTIKSYFSSHGWGSAALLRTVRFYNGDSSSSCDVNLHDYDHHCRGFYDANLGTTSEDIRHLACILAWYIWDNYTSQGIPVKIIAHSMGGVIARQALFDTPYMAQFPPYLTVEDVVTAGSPHQGLIAGAAAFFCGFCSQVAQMEGYNALTSNLNSSTFRGGFGQDPQGNTGTDWTNMASPDDEVLYYGCLTHYTVDCGLMGKATHKVEYPGTQPGLSPDYNHGGYLTDADDSWNAHVTYSDNAGANWTVTSTLIHSIHTMFYAVEYQSW